MDTKNADLSSLKIDRSALQKSGGKKPLGIILWVVGIIILLFVGYKFLAPLIFSSAVEVKTTTASMVTPGESSALLTASGYIVAQRKAAVASKGTGRLVYLGVVEGDPVLTNQIIARLEDSDIKAQLQQAKASLSLQEADLKEAQSNFNRVKALLEKGGATEVDFENAETRLKRVLASIELAKAGVVAAEVQMENTLIRAPFNGTVLTKNADVGEIVAPFAASASSRAAVVTIADMTSLQVEADVSESNIERITAGMECEIILDAYPNIKYPGYVDKIVPTADRSKATVMVKVGFKDYDSKVLPEMSAKVNFLSKKDTSSTEDKTPRLLVPLTAVATRNGNKVVFKILNNKAIAVTITVGKNFGSYVEILSGVGNGEVIIDNVNDAIVDGVEIKSN